MAGRFDPRTGIGPGDRVDERDGLSVDLYIDSTDERVFLNVRAALEELLHGQGVELEYSGDPIRGSWFQLGKAKLSTPEARAGIDERVAKVEHALQVQHLDGPLSEANKNNASAAQDLLAALEHTERAVLHIGSILIVKLTLPSGKSSVVAHTMSVAEQRALERDPSLLRNPDELFRLLRPPGDEPTLDGPPLGELDQADDGE